MGRKSKSPEIADEQRVCNYLRENPGFFNHHPELLEGLRLKSVSSGNIISLTERLTEVLRERNQELQERIAQLIEYARNNELLYEKTRQLILELAGVNSLEDINSIILTRLRHDFAVDTSTLYLFGNTEEDYGIAMVSAEEATAAIPDILKSPAPTCGIMRDEELEFLFPGNNAVGSAAIAPLISNKRSIGVLAVGNEDPQHYRSGMGTLFLSTIADMLGRIVPRMLPPEF